MDEQEWKEITCLEGKLCLKIPADWEEIAPSGERAGRIFPYGKLPQEIWGEGNLERIFTINFLKKQLGEKQVYPAIRQMQLLVSNIYPESIESQARKIKTEAGMAGVFSFITGGLREDNGHCMFILSVQGSMALGTYQFPAGRISEEKQMLRRMIKAMRADINKEKQILDSIWSNGIDIPEEWKELYYGKR